ncbi:MAG: adenosylcobinamide amidohydrolase [Deltaproteobacteria bacterium]
MSAFFTLILVLVTLSAAGASEEIRLPAELDAKASVKVSERDGFWEKTLVVTFPQDRRMLSTNDGFILGRIAVNHSAHPGLFKKVCEEMKTKDEVGGKVYMRKIKKKIAMESGVPEEKIAQLGTAADMKNLAIVTKTYPPFVVTSLVTAGARTNALRTGVDEGKHIEGKEPHGTVNVILLTNAELTDGAMARAIITLTEAKTAAFEDLDVPSSYTKSVQATGTGTDSAIVVSGVNGPKVTYTGGHSKIGELIGKAVYEGVMEALQKQNGFTRPHASQ